MKNITVDDEIGNEIIEMYRKRKEKMIEDVTKIDSLINQLSGGGGEKRKYTKRIKRMKGKRTTKPGFDLSWNEALLKVASKEPLTASMFQKKIKKELPGFKGKLAGIYGIISIHPRLKRTLLDGKYAYSLKK